MADLSQSDAWPVSQDAAGMFSKHARDRRAQLVAELLRSGWTAQEVSVGLKVIDAGGGVELAMSAMREAQRERRKTTIGKPGMHGVERSLEP